MPSKEIRLDAVDRKILYALDLDSRRPSAEIARMTRTTKNVVNYRINKLMRDQIIQGYYSVIDTTCLEREGYRIYLKWQYISPEKEVEIFDFLTKSHSTWWVGSIEGEWDAGVLLWVENTYEFRKFWLELMATYQEYIMNYSVCVYTRVYDINYAFLSPKERPEKITREVGSQKRVKISRVQERILGVLAENARMPTVEIAKKLELTPMVVKYNTQKLKEEGVIKGFRARINTELLGYIYYKINFWLKDRSRYHEILSYAQEHPNIVYVNETIGYADFEAELLVKQHAEFREILEEMKAIFGDTIREHNYFIYKKIHKIKYY